MLSGAVCIKDITPPSPTTTTPTAMIPPTNVTKSSSFPMPPSSQLNANPANSDKKSAY
jgi:hypothetical protein